MQRIEEANLIMENLKNLNELVEKTPELQEGEKQQIVRDFRVRMINKLLWLLKDMSK